MTSAFFTSANVGSTYDVPAGEGTIPTSATSPVHLALSDGTVQNVFDTETSALMLMHTMRGIRWWQCYANEDAVCVFVGCADTDKSRESKAPPSVLPAIHGRIS